MAVVTQRAVVRSREWAVTPPRVDLLSAKRETSGLRKHATCPAGLGVWSVRVGDKTEPTLHGSLTAWHRSLSYLTHTMPAAYASADKRSELIRAATLLLHEQGFQRTTLADVAGAADVPLGNVYYYFKSKEALAEAVIASHQAALRERFASWAAAHRDPRMRLRCLVRAPLDSADRIIQFGCPHGSLCQELEKLGAKAALAKAGARLLAVYIDWAEEQFRAQGCGRESGALAADLVGAVQGTMLLAHTMRSRDLLVRQLRRIERWLDGALTTKRERSRS
jgi:TetR/AcrR family transcriptional regulator, transcriptional repressor for nem operon